MRDPLKITIVGVGITLFIVGAMVAYRDASLDYNMGWWGGFAALCAGIGVGIAWTGATFDRHCRHYRP